MHALLGAIALDRAGANVSTAPANAGDEPVYQTHLQLQRLALPVRLAALDAHGLPDVRLCPRPTVHGVQTALVVGSGGPVHTDRDHRIQLQFHWQRGASGSHRLPAPSGDDNAPANDHSGTWVRVAESVAGANWGQNFIPRVGQEVLVGFLGGDIDRPVVVGSVYNGSGLPDAQGNQAGAGAAGAVGDAPAWFPGARAEGRLQAHQHPAVLAGIKTQELAASSHGSGGYNQLVFDDSPGAGRIELASSSAQTRLQLGHLLHQVDNRRLQPRGHGFDLATQAWGAVRAGQGILISAHRRPDSARHIDPREPRAQLDQGRELLHALAETAHKHNAKLGAEPDVVGAKKEDKARQLPVEHGLWASDDSLAGTEQRGETQDGGDGTATIGGGAGTVSAWGRPDLVIAAPAGIALHTPAAHVASSGASTALAAAQDIQHVAQAHHSLAAKDGIVLFTYGKAANPQKPNTETGIALHAASGSVNSQSQTGATRLTADKAIDVASTTGMVRIAAPQHVLLTAAGAAIHLEGGNITLKAPGKVEFKAATKELASAGGASSSLSLKKPVALKGCAKAMESAARSGAAV
ncbi:type VI secretion system Vgr family protein [Pseudorhodoferax sp.]|uniref:type VI secretion system Vgr family protein n=1 Tax=Pseudorhodoferax sp. TaxID=1993553 RepID=UPI0039E54A38